MHRLITFSVPPAFTPELLDKLKPNESVMALTVYYGASLKPPGDVVAVTTLNHGTDDVLRLALDAQKHGQVSVVTAEASSISVPGKQHVIDRDVDEGIWEEMESGLVHHGHLTVNFVVLMALGGAIAAAGLVAEPGLRVTAFVAASIIAPGFEPIAKIPLAVVLHRWAIVKQALISCVAGYATLIAAAALTFWGLDAIGQIHLEDLHTNEEIARTIKPNAGAIVISAAAALAGVVMITSFRQTVLAGPLIGLVLVPAAVITGAGVLIGNYLIWPAALKRLGLDTVFVVLLGSAVFWAKQRWIHRRAAIV